MRTWSFAGLFDKFATLERITRPPRMGHDVDTPDGAEQLAEREAEEEVHEPPETSIYDVVQGRPWGHWEPDSDGSEPGLTDDELVAIRGLIQERYDPESVADYMARAERVESGYIIHDGPTSDGEAYDRLQDLAAATYSSAIPPADDPAGVEHSPVPPAGTPDDLPTSELFNRAADVIGVCIAFLDALGVLCHTEIASQLNDFDLALRNRAIRFQK